MVFFGALGKVWGVDSRGFNVVLEEFGGLYVLFIILGFWIALVHFWA